MSFVSLARADVEQFVQGCGPDGSLLARRVSFPRHPEAAHLLRLMVSLAYRTVGKDQPQVLAQVAQRAALLRKIAVFLTRQPSERVFGEAMAVLLRAAKVMAEEPRLITDRINIAGMARIYEQRVRERGKRKRPKDVPERPVLWSTVDGAYRLTELVHPWHLVDEAAALRHCIGALPEDDEAIVEDLPYWINIRCGQSRVFSIVSATGPCCTIHVGMASRCLLEMQWPAKTWIRDAIPYDVLMASLRALKAMIPELQADAALPTEILVDVSCAFAGLGYALIAQRKPERPMMRVAGRPILNRAIDEQLIGRILAHGEGVSRG